MVYTYYTDHWRCSSLRTYGPAAGGAVNPSPVQAPTPGSNSTSGSTTPLPRSSISTNLIDLDSPAPTHIQGVMTDLHVNITN